MKEPLVFREAFFQEVEQFLVSAVEKGEDSQALLAAQILLQFYVKSADIDYLLRIPDIHTMLLSCPL